MAERRWPEDLRRWYENWWLTPEARDRRTRRSTPFGKRRRVPHWLLALAPFALIAAAVGVLLIAIATR
jgi:hypothetical protein